MWPNNEALYDLIPLNLIECISSRKFVKTLSILEFIFYGYLIFKRFVLIKWIHSYDKGLRDLVSFYDYEDGWNIIILFILMVSCLLEFVQEKIAWIVKQVGLIFILIALGISYFYVFIVFEILLTYFSLNKVSAQFNIDKNDKAKYYSIIALSVIVLFVGNLFIDFVTY